MAHRQPVQDAAGPAREIPDKLYFRIGEVAALCDVPAYVLRFWETEFPQLRPNKGGTGQRLYRKRDVEMALRVKHLLYDEGYTIPGARQLLKGEARGRDPQMLLAVEPVPERAPAEQSARPGVDRGHLAALRAELRDLLRMLSAAPERGRGTAPGPVQRAEPLFEVKSGEPTRGAGER